ncbi:MAG: saccharopine dehydrogenase NADP-binding domain-containing protein, partial [Bacteroidota bacterium]
MEYFPEALPFIRAERFFASLRIEKKEKEKMKYTVIGAGMMGSAAAYDLATTNPNDEIVLADINIQQAKSVAAAIGPNVTPVRVDVNNAKELVKLLEGSNAIISAVSYSVNFQTTKAAIEAGVPICDLGGNNEVVERQFTL